MTGFIDRARAARLMQAAGLDGMVLIDPHSLRWASGADPGVATLFGRAGAALLLVPADPLLPMAAVVGDLQAAAFQAASGIDDVRAHRIWVDTARFADGALLVTGSTPRPATFDAAAALAQFAGLLAAHGLASARLGIEHAFLPVADAELFNAACPQVRWQNVSPLVARLRAIKQPQEAAWLALAARAAEAGVAALLPAIRPGMQTAAMAAMWREAALAEAARLGAPGVVETWAYIAVGTDGFAPGGPVATGDLIKIDVGCVVAGYSSDSARTAVLGRPHPEASRVHAALLAAFEAGEALLRPGTRFSEIHAATARTMHQAGFPFYARGHFGHSLGAGGFNEHWPFMAADADAVLEPGMVVAFETPWYVRGLGGFMIEDQYAIPQHGQARPEWRLPRGLVEL